MLDLVKPVQRVLGKCLNLKEGEDFLMVIDSNHPLSIGEAALAVAHSMGANAHLITLPRWPYMAEPSKVVVDALKACDAGWVICPIHYTKGRQEAIDATHGRFVDSPFLTEDVLIRLLGQDLDAMNEKCAKVAQVFNDGETLEFYSKSGTEIKMSIKGNAGQNGNSVVTEPGQREFLPPAEAAVTPVAGTANGRIVINGSLRPAGIVDKPVTITVENGFATKIEGGSAAEIFKEYMESFDDPNAFAFPVHIGPGFNPGARLCGNILEDERVEGMITVGFGCSVYLPGGTIDSVIHSDGTVKDGTIIVDGKTIVEDGKLVTL